MARNNRIDRAAPRRLAGTLPGPERLVGFGFRLWSHGCQTGDLEAWQTAWSLYCGMFGPVRAEIAVAGLSDWVQAIGRCGTRAVTVECAHCPLFCRDECLAISMIAACQHRTCPALRACAFALIESGATSAAAVDRVAAAAQTFADTLASLDQVLSPSSIVVAPAPFAQPVGRAN